MENKHSSDSVAEDLIRAFVQIGCAELHTKTLIEKAEGKLSLGTTEEMIAISDELEQLNIELTAQADLRRKLMYKLFTMYEGDKAFWCEVKHLGIGAYTLFEAYQGSNDDSDLYNLALEANKTFIIALSHFLGMEIPECASCFGDFLKGATNDNK